MKRTGNGSDYSHDYHSKTRSLPHISVWKSSCFEEKRAENGWKNNQVSFHTRFSICSKDFTGGEVVLSDWRYQEKNPNDYDFNTFPAVLNLTITCRQSRDNLMSVFNRGNDQFHKLMNGPESITVPLDDEWNGCSRNEHL